MNLNNLGKQDLLEILSDLNPVEDHSGDNLIIDCPSCGQRECSISINKEGHLWGCFRLKMCGERGNIWKLLKSIGKLEDFINKRVKNEDFIDLKELFKKKDNGINNIPAYNDELPKINKPFGWERITSGDVYLDKRGFKSYMECEVGRTKLDPKLKNDYVIFLVRDNGEIKGYVGRHVWDKSKIEEYNRQCFLKTGKRNKIKRYNNSLTPFSKLLYGYDEIEEISSLPVMLVEGIFDKHAIDYKINRYQKIFHCCATFKAAISNEQIAKLLLKDVKDIILFYDPDVINIIKKNVQKLCMFFNVKVVISSINKDPDEMSEDEIINVLSSNIYNSNNILDEFIQKPRFKF